MELSEIEALFIVGEDSMTVHLRGYFDGPLREFVWLVPVPAGSKIQLSHNDIFRWVNERTQPRFQLFAEGDATPEYLEEKTGFLPDLPVLTYVNEHSERCDVLADEVVNPIVDFFPCPIRLCETVLLEYVGERETQALTIIDARSHAEVSDWALARGYRAEAMDGEVVQSYLDGGQAILAVETAPPEYLHHLKRVNRIQPLAFTYGVDGITVPLKSATSEGTDRQGLTVWIAAESRAIPENYLNVHLNPARLTWPHAYGLFSGKPGNYHQVLSNAIAETEHPALVTEYAVEGTGPGDWEEPHADLDALRDPESLDAFLTDLWHGGMTPKSPWGEVSTEFELRFLQLLRKHIPIPESVLEAIRQGYNGREERFREYAESQFYSFPNEYEDHYEDEWFNFSGFVDDWIARIQEPKARAHEALAGRPYLTRLTTFYFGDAETVDPVLGFNADLGQVNDRPGYGKVGFECREGGEYGFWDVSNLMAVVGLEGGTILRFGFDWGNPFLWRILRGASEVPPAASESIEQLSTSGSAVVVPRQMTTTVVAGTIPDSGFRTVEFSRMVPGRHPRYQWSTTASRSGEFEAIISSGDPAGVQGSYQLRVRNRDGEILDEWYDIPLEGNRRQILELVPGERARVAAVERLDAAILEAADFDGDGTVGFEDFFLFAEAFGGSDPRFDLDGSGTVDLADFLLFADHFDQPAREKLLARAREMIGLPDTPQLRSAPNPFNSRTVISWFLLTPGPVRLEIYNALGQRVRTLVDGVQAAGRQRVFWKARDQSGAGVAAGVYLSRLQYPGGVQTQRLLYLK